MSLVDVEVKSTGSRADHRLNTFLLSFGEGSGVTDLDNIKTGD